MPKIARATSVLPGADESREGDDLAAAHLERDVGEHALARQPVDLQHDVTGVDGQLRKESVHVAADHRADDRLRRQLFDRLRQHVPPVAHDRDALTDREDLLEPVRDEEDRAAVGAERLDDAEQPRHLGRRQRRRRLVHHDHPRVRRQRLRDLDELLIGDREPAGEPVRVEANAEPLEDRRRLASHSPRVDATEPLERLHTDEDVLGDGQIGEERRLLEDDRDPGRLRLLGRVEDRLLAVDEQAPGVGPVDAREDLDQRRLAGAVLADEAVDLTADQFDVAVLESVHGAEALLGVLEGEECLGMLCLAHDRRLKWGTARTRRPQVVRPRT